MAEENASVSFKEIQDKLSAIDVSQYVENKKDGKGGEKTYLSWAYAWGELIKNYPEATYEVERFGEEKLPFLRTKEGYMVFTKITICGHTREMWLPIQDSSFETMKEESYKKSYKSGGEKTIDACDMSDVNKAIMRCLVKNIAMFGLGLNIYQGEDLPNVNDSVVIQKPEICDVCGKQITAVGKYSADFIVRRSIQNYGKPMCFDCAANKASQVKKAESNTQGE